MAVYCERSFGGVGRVVSGHLLTVLVSLLVIYVQPAQTQFVIPTTTPRATVTFDVVFALDDSSNVPDNLWSAMLSLMSSYVDRFRVGLGNVRVGVVRYSDRATIAFDLNEYRSGTAVKTAISQLQHLSTSSQRNLAHAFQITLAHLLVRGQRYFAAQLFIIITNGESLDTTQTRNIAQFAKTQGWKVIGVFVGSNTTAGFQEIQRISFDQQTVQQLRVDTFNDLQYRVVPLALASAVATSPTLGRVFYAFNSTLDIAFLVDGTFTSSEWSTIRQFMIMFTDRFYVLQNLTRFAVVQFSQSAETTFDFTRYSSNLELRAALGSLQQQATGNNRNLAAALTYTYSNVFSQSRANAASVLIIFARGESTSTLRSVAESTMLRSNGVKVITVYIGNDTSFGYVEQRQVVTDIGELASFRVDRADLLINENKTDLLQLAANIPAPISYCGNPLDLVFLVDDSSSISEAEWPRVLGFLRAVTGRFDVSRDATRIGVVRYATRADIVYRLTSTQSIEALQRAITTMRHIGGSTNLAEAMRLAFQQVFLPATRPGAARVVVIITDGYSDSQTQTIIQANFLKLVGIKIVCIGVVLRTNKGYEELKQIATDPEEVVRLQVDNFDRLGASILPLVAASCPPPPPPGEPGVVGSIGSTGQPGLLGARGDTGPSGLMGWTGQQGPSGQQGQPGFTGPTER